ncbi:MAG: hypothetical protein V4691_03295, partial [Pseudomonadota bacterium]
AAQQQQLLQQAQQQQAGQQQAPQGTSQPAPTSSNSVVQSLVSLLPAALPAIKKLFEPKQPKVDPRLAAYYQQQTPQIDPRDPRYAAYIAQQQQAAAMQQYAQVQYNPYLPRA